MKRGCSISFLGMVALAVGFWGYIKFDNWRWQTSAHQYANLQKTLPGIPCDDAELKVLKQIDTGAFLQDFYYETQIVASEECVSAIKEAAIAEGFTPPNEQSDQTFVVLGDLQKSDGPAYAEAFKFEDGTVIWIRSKI